jgi:hypothetical protein
MNGNPNSWVRDLLTKHCKLQNKRTCWQQQSMQSINGNSGNSGLSGFPLKHWPSPTIIITHWDSAIPQHLRTKASRNVLVANHTAASVSKSSQMLRTHNLLVSSVNGTCLIHHTKKTRLEDYQFTPLVVRRDPETLFYYFVTWLRDFNNNKKWRQSRCSMWVLLRH